MITLTFIEKEENDMKKSFVKAGAALLLGCCIAGTVAGCGGGGSSDEITFYHYAVTNALTAQLEQKLSDFTESTGIKVKHVPVSKDNYNATISTKFTSSKNDMDVMYLDQPLLAQYANSNLLYNLDEYVTQSSEDAETVEDDNSVGFKFNKNAFNESAWATTVYNNSVYGIPLTINTSVLFYNVETIKAACGLSTDAEAVAAVEAIETWSDLKSFAESIDGIGTKYALFGGMGSGGYMGWYSQCFIGAAGGKLYDDATKTVLPNDDGAITRAFEMMKYMFDKSPETLYNSTTGFTGTSSSPAGKVLFSLSHSSDIKDLDVAYTTFGAIPFPGETTEIGSVSNLGGENLVIPQKSANKEAALKLIKYLVSEKCMSFFQSCTNNFAAVEKYASIETFATDTTSPTYKMYSVVKTQLSSAQVRPVVAGWMQVNDNGIPTHLKAYVEGNKTFDEALSSIRNYAAQYLK